MSLVPDYDTHTGRQRSAARTGLQTPYVREQMLKVENIFLILFSQQGAPQRNIIEALPSTRSIQR